MKISYDILNTIVYKNVKNLKTSLWHDKAGLINVLAFKLIINVLTFKLIG